MKTKFSYTPAIKHILFFYRIATMPPNASPVSACFDLRKGWEGGLVVNIDDRSATAVLTKATNVAATAAVAASTIATTVATTVTATGTTTATASATVRALEASLDLEIDFLLLLGAGLRSRFGLDNKI